MSSINTQYLLGTALSCPTHPDRTAAVAWCAAGVLRPRHVTELPPASQVQALLNTLTNLRIIIDGMNAADLAALTTRQNSGQCSSVDDVLHKHSSQLPQPLALTPSTS